MWIHKYGDYGSIHYKHIFYGCLLSLTPVGGTQNFFPFSGALKLCGLPVKVRRKPFYWL